MIKQTIGICSWSLKNNLSEITAVLQETGVRSLHLDVAVADEFAEAIQQNGWSISATMLSFPQEDYSTLETIRETGGIMPDDVWESNRQLVVNAIEKTAKLGVKDLTFHVGFIDHNDVVGYQKFTKRILELADIAQENGVMILMETGQEVAADLRHCLEELNHSALGVNFDPANMILYGKGDPIAAVDVLAPWIKHVHIKDATATTQPGTWGTEVPWGDGEVGHKAFIQALDKIGFTGAVAVEREAGETRAADIKLAIQRLGEEE